MSTEADLYFLRRACFYAAHFATDPSTQNGAILVGPDGGVVGEGANHFPMGVRYTPERWERPTKYSYVEHAERNAIFDAARGGCKTEGATLYAVWVACADCARAIIQAGVREVVGLRHPDDATNARWHESCRIGLEMLAESGVVTRHVDGPLFPDGTLSLRRDGQPHVP